MNKKENQLSYFRNKTSYEVIHMRLLEVWSFFMYVSTIITSCHQTSLRTVYGIQAQEYKDGFVHLELFCSLAGCRS